LAGQSLFKEPLAASETVEEMLVYPVGEQSIDLNYRIDGYPGLPTRPFRFIEIHGGREQRLERSGVIRVSK
jgi:hypothetical protein